MQENNDDNVSIPITKTYSTPNDANVGLISNEVKKSTFHMPDSTFHLMNYKFVGLMVTVIMFPVFFFAIYPAIVLSMVNDAGISTNTVSILNPTNTTFGTSVNINFDSQSPIKANLDLKSIELNWNAPGGGNMFDVQHLNRLDVSTKKSQTLNGLSVVQDALAFVNFITQAISQPSIEWQMASPHAIFSSGFGKVQIDILKTASLGGFNNFSIPPRVLSINTTLGTPEFIVNYALIELTTTSKIIVDFGQNLNFVIRSRNIPIGHGYIPDAGFRTNTFLINATILMETHTQAEADELNYVLSQYIMGFNLPMSLTNVVLPNPVIWLSPALSTIRLDATIPGLTDKLLQYVTIYASSFSLIKKTIKFDGNLFNPIMSEITVRHLIGDIYYNGSRVGNMNVPGLNIRVAGLSNITTPLLTANVVDLAVATQLLSIGFGLVNVVFQLIQLDVGLYPVSLVYNQSNIPCYIGK